MDASFPVIFQQALMQKLMSPSHVRSRFFIVRHEIFAGKDHQISYMEDKELLELDRRIISTGRAVISGAETVNTTMKTAPKQVTEVVNKSLAYSAEIFRQLREVKKPIGEMFNDLTRVISIPG